MRFLLDTHLLLQAAGYAGQAETLSATAFALLSEPSNDLVFSVASLWEVSIKRGLNRPDFQTDPRLLRRGLIDNGYEELTIRGRHAMCVADLPRIHKDPFDRMLVAQATVEEITLLTSDAMLAGYPGPIRRV